MASHPLEPETKVVPESIIKALPARLRGQWTEMRTVYFSAVCNHVLGPSGNELFIENSTEACRANVTSFSSFAPCLRDFSCHFSTCWENQFV